jgi:hypothetical protein
MALIAGRRPFHLVPAADDRAGTAGQAESA